MDVHEVTAKEWAEYCHAETEARIREACRRDLSVNLPTVVRACSTGELEALIDYCLMLDTEGYYYFESRNL